MMVLVSLKARTLLPGGPIWHGPDSGTRRGPCLRECCSGVRHVYNRSMASKWELPEKTFDKGRRARRHLTADGHKALRHLRVAMVLVATFFAVLFALALHGNP